MMSNVTRKTHTLLLNCAVFLIFLAQIYYENNILKSALYISWLLLFGLSLVCNELKLKLTKFSILFLFGYLLYSIITCAICIASPEREIPYYITILLIPLFVTICSDLNKNTLTSKDIHLLCKNYILFCVIFGVYLLIISTRYYSTLEGGVLEYAIAQKNSAGQIIGIGILLLFYVFIRKSIGWQRNIWCGVLLFLLYVLIQTQCRTSIVAVCFVFFLYLVFCAKINKKISNKNIIFIIIGLLLCFIFSEQLVDMLKNAFLIEKYRGADLNTISSGRIESIGIAWQKYQNNIFFGIGKYYVDCSYIDILVENGIIGFFIIEFIWAYRVFLNFKNNTIKNFVFGLTVFFVIESMFEGFPPYGPGACCFFFWFLSELNFHKKV